MTKNHVWKRLQLVTTDDNSQVFFSEEKLGQHWWCWRVEGHWVANHPMPKIIWQISTPQKLTNIFMWGNDFLLAPAAWVGGAPFWRFSSPRWKSLFGTCKYLENKKRVWMYSRACGICIIIRAIFGILLPRATFDSIPRKDNKKGPIIIKVWQKKSQTEEKGVIGG